MSTVADVYTYLETQGITGGSTGWLAQRRLLTDDTKQQDQVVAIREDGGAEPEFPADAGIGDSAMEEPGVLISIRAAAWDGDAGVAKGLEIIQALHGLRNVVLGASGSVSYLRVRAMTPEPVFVQYDQQGRPLHTVAFRLLKDVEVGS